jgi:hypothetical protein
MLLTSEEVLEIADQKLDYSDFGNFYGDADYIVEFAYEIIRAEKLKGGHPNEMPIM